MTCPRPAAAAALMGESVRVQVVLRPYPIRLAQVAIADEHGLATTAWATYMRGAGSLTMHKRSKHSDVP